MDRRRFVTGLASLTVVRTTAGALDGTPPPPPPDSWASDSSAAVAI